MLCQTMQKQASWVWNSLRTARAHESKIGEESITDFLVLQLKKQAKGAYFVESFTRPKEKVTGADWELWLTGPSGKWLGLRVQAKVISIDARRYPQLHYRQKDGTYQLDRLVADANRHGATPLYCLYSYWKGAEAGRVEWPCGTFKRNSRLFGVSWMAVSDVRALKSAGTDLLKKVAPTLSPFHCLFCCAGYGGGDLPERAHAFLQRRNYMVDRMALLAQPPYYVSQVSRPGELTEDFVDVHDENLYRVTIVRERGAEEPAVSASPGMR